MFPILQIYRPHYLLLNLVIFYKNYQFFKNLFVSPINTESKIKKLIGNEIINAKSGKYAWIKIKINNITSYSLIRSLYEASRA